MRDPRPRAPAGNHLFIAPGVELYVDDRSDDERAPGWFIRRRPDDGDVPVTVRQVLRIAGTPYARQVVSLTVAVIGDLHQRARADDSEACAHAGFRLTRELADAVHELALAAQQPAR
jgi:hypothetical protein